jgi:predicted TIM-barrel fold metal-dependent hydrolase
MNIALERRAFLRKFGITALGLLAPFGCEDPERYHEGDIRALAEQRRRERDGAGRGPFGSHRYQGYRGLAKLPYFEVDTRGRLRCVVDDLPDITDFHAHLGFSILFSPQVDWLAPSDRVRHLLDCDSETPGCELDLDVYVNANFTSEDLDELRWETLGQAFWGSARAATHTIPNLLAEMDDMGVRRAVLLPIAFGLPYRDDSSGSWYAAIQQANERDRLLQGGSVHPRDADAIASLRAQVARGARAIKLHPAVQRFYPDSAEAHPIYEECGRLGVPVFFHGGRAGIEPEYTHRFTLMRHYEEAIGQHPEVRFVLGHAGARDVADAIPLALRHRNLWLGIHGQGITILRELIDRLGAHRLLFGTDWPFYHLAASLAKVLIVTEGQPQERQAILQRNAQSVLGEG